MKGPRSASSVDRLTAIGALGVTVILTFPAITPLSVVYPGIGLDYSWIAVAGEAQRLGLVFGRDIIWTCGQLCSLNTHYFASETFATVSLVTGALFLFFATSQMVFSVDARSVIPAAIIGLLVLYMPYPFLMMLTFPLIMLFARLLHRRSLMRVLTLSGCMATAVAVLAKITVFPIGLLAAVLVDYLDIRDRRIPIHTLVFFATMALLFLLTYHTIAPLLSFLLMSGEVAAGYTEAMASAGSAGEFIGFSVACALFLIVVLQIEWSRIQRKQSDPNSSAAIIILLCGYLLVTLKSGFVRADIGHTVMSWFGLALAAAMYASLRWRHDGRITVILTAAFVIVPAFLVVPMRLNAHVDVSMVDAQAFFSNGPKRIRDSFRELFVFCRSPQNWMDQASAHKHRAFAAVRAAQPLPPLVGTVDVIPSMQSSLLAHGLSYHPRVTIQEYASYTRSLIEANRRFFRGSDAPEYLLFGVESLDDRHPALTEGPLWPDFLRFYEPTSIWGDLLVLRRRANPPADLLGPASTLTAASGEEITLGQGQIPIFLAANIEMTWLGKIVNALYRAPPVFMQANYQDHGSVDYKLVPAIAREGFIVSPFLGDSFSYLMLATGSSNLGGRLRYVRSITFTTNFVGRWFYRNTINLTLRSLLLPQQSSQDHDQTLMAQLTEFRDLIALRTSSNARADTVRMIPEGLFAHAPSRLSLDARGSKVLDVGFGILDSAWQSGRTDGVCFRISAQPATGSPGLTGIFERCLRPQETAEDRFLQQTMIAIPDGTLSLVFETLCGPRCDWDWSYWSSVKLE